MKNFLFLTIAVTIIAMWFAIVHAQNDPPTKDFMSHFTSSTQDCRVDFVTLDTKSGAKNDAKEEVAVALLQSTKEDLRFRGIFDPTVNEDLASLSECIFGT